MTRACFIIPARWALHCPLADAELLGDDFVRLSLNHQVHDVTLPRRQAGQPCARLFASSRRNLDRMLCAIECTIDAREKLFGPNRFFEEVEGAGLHRRDRHRRIALAGDHDRGKVATFGLQALQQLDPAHARHDRVDHEASRAVRTVGIEERRAAAIRLDRVPVFVQQLLHGTKNDGVIIHHENRGLHFASRADRVRLACGDLRPPFRGEGEQGLNLLRQLFRLGRLVEMCAAGTIDRVQGIRRDIAGQDEGRYLALQRLAQLRDDLDAGQVSRQIVVCDDDIRRGPASRRYREGLSRAGNRGRAVPLRHEQDFEHLAHSGIVLDDQDIAG